jgi:hypothetical protein
VNYPSNRCHDYSDIAIVSMLAATAAALIAAVGINTSIQQQTTAAQNDNATDIENTEINFIFKQKLKNDCSGFSTCSNAASELFGGVGQS